MKKVLAFAASNSSRSINRQLVKYATTLLKSSKATLIDLNDFDMPIYGIDYEEDKGIPDKAYEFKQLVIDHDGIMISFAEHNGAYSAAFKNIFDWMSRIKGSTWAEKPMLLMATSPGRRGGASVLEMAVKRFPFNGGIVSGSFSLPSFSDNFVKGEGVVDEPLKIALKTEVEKFERLVVGEPVHSE